MAGGHPVPPPPLFVRCLLIVRSRTLCVDCGVDVQFLFAEIKKCNVSRLAPATIFQHCFEHFVVVCRREKFWHFVDEKRENQYIEAKMRENTVSAAPTP